MLTATSYPSTCRVINYYAHRAWFPVQLKPRALQAARSETKHRKRFRIIPLSSNIKAAAATHESFSGLTSAGGHTHSNRWSLPLFRHDRTCLDLDRMKVDNGESAGESQANLHKQEWDLRVESPVRVCSAVPAAVQRPHCSYMSSYVMVMFGFTPCKAKTVFAQLK